MRTGFFIGLLCAGCAGVFLNTNSRGKAWGASPVVVQSFVRGFGQRPGFRLSSLFTGNVRVEIKGLGVIAQGKRELDGLFGYASAVKSKLKAFDVSVRGDTVFCRLEEENRLLSLLGLGPVSYEASFIFEGSKVSALVIKPGPGTGAILFGQGLGFLNWLKENEAEAVDELMPGGKFRFTAESGKRLVELVSRWRGLN